MLANKQNRGQPEKQGNLNTGGNLNMRGIFLHVMADALGSVNVIISAIIMWHAPEWTYAIYVDPGMAISLRTCSFSMLQKKLQNILLLCQNYCFNFQL